MGIAATSTATGARSRTTIKRAARRRRIPKQTAYKFFRNHPKLAERAAFALMRLHAYKVDADWRTYTTFKTWKFDYVKREGQSFERPGTRKPPTPFDRKPLVAKNMCHLCGFEIFKGGWWWGGGKKHPMASRHACCQAIYCLMIGQISEREIARRQEWKCAIGGEDMRSYGHDGTPYLLSVVELDHRVPLWKVRAEWNKHRWPDVLRFWLPENIQAVLPVSHRRKSAVEAAERAQLRRGCG